MKSVFLIRCFCVALILGSILPVSLNKALAQLPGTVQARIDYKKYMQLGYTATRQRNYAEAIDYFKQALYEKPGDRYATIAIRNLEIYVSRDRRAGNQRKTYVTYIPTNLGVAKRRIPGATRSGYIHLDEAGKACIPSKKRLTALTPEFDTQKTTKANPSFFFYLPQTSAPVMELVLQDDQEEVIYKKILPVPRQSGIVSLSLPVDANVPKLKVGKSYRWYFSLICDRKERSSDYVVYGSIERIAPDQTLQTQLEKAKPEEQAAIYALSGIWENTLTILTQLRQSSPKDLAIKNDWEDLLRSGGLEAIVQEPLVPCCTLK
jgi:tetratricopeptide (TPR) repeat protein